MLALPLGVSEPIDFPPVRPLSRCPRCESSTYDGGRCDACGFRPPPGELWLPLIEPTRRERWAAYGGRLGCATWLLLLAIGGLLVGAPWLLAFVPIGGALAFAILGGIHDLAPRRGRRFLALSADGYGVRGVEGHPGGSAWSRRMLVAARPEGDGLVRVWMRSNSSVLWWRPRERLKNLATILLLGAAGGVLWLLDVGWFLGVAMVACALIIIALVVSDVVHARRAGHRGLEIFTRPRRERSGDRGWLVDPRGVTAAELRVLLRRLRASETTQRDAFHLITLTPECLACGYDRSGLPPRRRCPECGEPARHLTLAVTPTPDAFRLSRRGPVSEAARRLERRFGGRAALVLVAGLLVAMFGGGLIVELLQIVPIAKDFGGFLLIVFLIACFAGTVLFAIWPRRQAILRKLADDRPRPLALLSPRGVTTLLTKAKPRRAPWPGLTFRLTPFGRDTNLWRLHAAEPDAAGLLDPAADVLFLAKPDVLATLRRRLARWAPAR